MDVHAIRRENLARLAREFGGTAALAAALDRDASQISRYLTSGCRLGSRFARYVETQLTQPYGWMDVSHPNIPAGTALLASAERLVASAPGDAWLNWATQLLDLVCNAPHPSNSGAWPTPSPAPPAND
ncbi:hypothetical protein [Chitinimonas taiwanensis]|uniref:hypothetical protein n=1 Tax=Chitinimonas taiwanensis TaxID=240412 RepID=UPI0035B0D617